MRLSLLIVSILLALPLAACAPCASRSQTPATPVGNSLESQINQDVRFEYAVYSGPGKIADYVKTPQGAIYLFNVPDPHPAYGYAVSVRGTLRFKHYAPLTRPSTGVTIDVAQDHFYIDHPMLVQRQTRTDLTLDDFLAIPRDMTIPQLHQRIGYPNRDIGSGIYIMEYLLSNGETVRVDGLGRISTIVYKGQNLLDRPVPATTTSPFVATTSQPAAQVFEEKNVTRSPDLRYLIIAAYPYKNLEIARQNAQFLADHGISVSLSPQRPNAGGTPTLVRLISIQGFPGPTPEAEAFRKQIIEIGKLHPDAIPSGPFYADSYFSAVKR